MRNSNPHENRAPRVVQIVAATALAATVAIALPQAAGKDVTPPAVPTDLEVPAGHTAYLIAHAYGRLSAASCNRRPISSV